jgi:hypothetical protein
LHDLPPKQDVQFDIHLPGQDVVFPEIPVTIPSSQCFIWPFNLDLGPGARLAWGTVQPITAVDDRNTRTVFFAETKGVPAQLAFASDASPVTIQPGRGVAVTKPLADGRLLQVVVLSEEDSLALWEGTLQGHDHVFLTKAGMVLDGDTLRLTGTNMADLNVGIYPAPSLVDAAADGIFQRYFRPVPRAEKYRVGFKKVQAAGPPREIPMGKIDQPMAAAPLDPDFKEAAVWSIRIPGNVDLATDPILRFHYVGDVARVTLNGKMLTDDFYNGNSFDIGLRRHAPEILSGDLRIEILPLRKDAPIYMADKARPDFGHALAVANLRSVEIIPRYQTQLTTPSLDSAAAKVSQR